MTGRQARPNDAKGVLVPKKAGRFNSSFRVGLITAPWTTPILMLRHRRGHFLLSLLVLSFSAGISHFFHFDCQLFI